MRLSEILGVNLIAIRPAGFPGYSSDHFELRLGAYLGSEEWQVISANSEAVHEPGMVMALGYP